MGSGYVLRGTIYQPLDICIFDQDWGYSIYWTCIAQELYIIYWSSENCDGSIIYSAAESKYQYDCDPLKLYNDYIKYSIYHLDSNGSVQCDNTTNYRPNSYSEIINKCLYDPQYNVYKMDTCTDTGWTTFRYTDSNCENLQYTGNTIDICKHNESYSDITTCTAKMNSIGDQFGYVQYRKGSNLHPLNKCIISSSTFSYLFICINNDPYYYYWRDNGCSDLLNSDDNFKITPFAYSCSSNTHDFAVLKVYPNDNNCTESIPQTNYTK